MPAVPLAEALAAGTAAFGTSPIAAAQGASVRKLRRRLTTYLAGFPVEAGTLGVRHLSGPVFTSLGLSGGQHLVGMGKSDPPPLEPGRRLTVVTGSCLFGLGTVTGWADGRPVPLLNLPRQLAEPPAVIHAVTTDPRPHIYERETTRVLGGFLRDLAALPGLGEVTVHFHVPHAEYWLWGVDALRRGLMTAPAFSAYERAIEHRVRMIGREFLCHLGGKVTLRTESPLDWARYEWGAPWAAVGRHGQLWAQLAGFAGDDSLVELCNLSYVYAYLAAGRRARLMGESLMFAETPDEVPVWRRARMIAAVLGEPLEDAAVCYVHPGLVATGVSPAYLYNVPLS